MQYIQETRQTPVRWECDVLVAGGGTAGLVAALAAGDFNKALALYDKITPFPHLLSAGCEAPCQGKCKLCSLGEGIAVRDLEAAAVAYGEMPRKKGFLRKKIFAP